MEDKKQQTEQWEYKTLYKPSESAMTAEGMKGWEAYAVTIEPFIDYGGNKQSPYIVYLKRRVRK